MKDAAYNRTKALPNANANNNTTSMDLNTDPSAGGAFSNQFRLAFVQVDFPALSDHTNVSVTNLITLQDSSDNANFANTAPLIQIGVVGVANGNPATSFYVPLPPKVRRYVRFNQLVPTNGGIGNNAVVNYDLVT